jgi:lysophospholipase L1-like esterase
LNGEGVVVSYGTATVAGGAPPFTIVCNLASGSVFPVGSTTVACSVTDARQRTSSCSFNVVVSAPPRVNGSVFDCFGDSLTEGLVMLSLPRSIPNPPNSYPADLQNLLSGRYTAQTPRVVDDGIGGERVQAGLARLPQVLSAERPDALLLLEGVNDLNSLGESAIPGVVEGLRSMIRIGRGRGITVFLGTLLPQRPGAPRAFAPTLIEPTNERLRAMAAEEGAVLVDLYRDFGGEAGALIASDGLHPTTAGYQQIADSFFAAIRGRLEMPGAWFRMPIRRLYP